MHQKVTRLKRPERFYALMELISFHLMRQTPIVTVYMNLLKPLSAMKTLRILLNCLKLFFRASVVFRTPGRVETNLNSQDNRSESKKTARSVVILRGTSPARKAFANVAGYSEELHATPGISLIGYFAEFSLDEQPEVFLVDGRFAYKAYSLDIVNNNGQWYEGLLYPYRSDVSPVPVKFTLPVPTDGSKGFTKACHGNDLYLITEFSYDKENHGIKHNPLP